MEGKVAVLMVVIVVSVAVLCVREPDGLFKSLTFLNSSLSHLGRGAINACTPRCFRGEGPPADDFDGGDRESTGCTSVKGGLPPPHPEPPHGGRCPCAGVRGGLAEMCEAFR